MSDKELNAVFNLDAEKQYEYFVKKIADSEQVWGLYKNSWAIVEDDFGSKAVPFWPKEEFAIYCSKDDWLDYTPKYIDLESFILKWIPGMKRDSINICIFYTIRCKGVIVSGDKLVNDLNIELENY